MATSGPSPIELHGPPELLEGLALLPAPADLPVFDVELPGYDIMPSLLGQMERAGTNATFLRLVLPDDTPPGDYNGTVRLDETEHAVQLHVNGEPQLRFGRSVITVEGAVGSDIPISTLVTNVGNVPVTISRAGAVGLFEVDGITRRIHDGLRDSRLEGAGRLGRILDGLSESDGGLARIAIKKGSGKLDTGSGRPIEAMLRLDGRAKPGVTYQGVWSLHGAETSIRVTVSEEGGLK